MNLHVTTAAPHHWAVLVAACTAGFGLSCSLGNASSEPAPAVENTGQPAQTSAAPQPGGKEQVRKGGIRPFRVNFPEEALADLRRRIAATRWPEKETVADHSQGVPLDVMRDLARHWANDYDWRKCEAKLNAL